MNNTYQDSILENKSSSDRYRETGAKESHTHSRKLIPILHFFLLHQNLLTYVQD